MERKGLSQILYLIIAASVLMMIAMVITFTATDTIGGLGGTAEEGACSDALTAQCTATGAPMVSVPTTCVSEGQYVQPFLGGNVHSVNDPASTSSSTEVDAAGLASGTTGYIECTAVP